jgi:hypothetical protein
VLKHWGLEDLTWSACQVVSELVTNVIIHTNPNRFGTAASCRLTLKLLCDALAIEVWDSEDVYCLYVGICDGLAFAQNDIFRGLCPRSR